MTPRQNMAAAYLAERGLDPEQIAAVVAFATNGRRTELADCTDADLDDLARVARGIGTDIHLWRDTAGAWCVIVGTPLWGEDGDAA